MIAGKKTEIIRDKGKVLLHICCGVCGLHSLRKLKEEGYTVEGLFYNPNIYPVSEYELRRVSAKKACLLENVEFVELDYRPKVWDNLCGNLDSEPEGQARCKLCYKLRLRKAYEVAKERNCSLFTTTLTISPHKRSSDIFEIADSFSKSSFLYIDFKKNHGFAKTMDLAKQHNLYRQNYCGCVFSLRGRQAR